MAVISLFQCILKFQFREDLTLAFCSLFTDDQAQLPLVKRVSYQVLEKGCVSGVGVSYVDPHSQMENT